MEVEEGLEWMSGGGPGGAIVPASRRSQTIVRTQSHKEIDMAFGKNYAEIVGHLGGDVVINHLASGGRVANLSVATDESYFDKSGQKVDQTEWHRVVTFQDGLIDMLERHAKKGRLISVEGKLRTRRWKKDGDDSWRYSTEILVVPGNRVQFYDKPNRANGNGAQAEPAPANGEAMPAGGDPAQADDLGSDRIPF